MRIEFIVKMVHNELYLLGNKKRTIKKKKEKIDMQNT